MPAIKKVRIYDLAKELKQDTKRVMEELRREGVDVSVPSNLVSKEIADKIRRLFSKQRSSEKQNVTEKETKTNLLTEIAKSKNIIRFLGYNRKGFEPKSEIPEIVTKIKHITKEVPNKLNIQYKEQPICKEKLKFKVQEKHKVKPNAKIYKPNLIDSERNIIIKSQNKSYRKLCSDLHKYLHALREENCASNIPQKENTYDQLIYLLRKKLTEYVQNKHPKYEMKNFRLKLYEDLSAEINSIQNRKQIIFAKLKSLKIKSSEPDNKSSEIIVDEVTNGYSSELICVKKLPWIVMPNGEWHFESILKKYRTLCFSSKWRERKYDENRLNQIKLHLNPNLIYEGIEEFEGYIVCCFSWTEKVILECPFYGNATYIIKGDWEEITKVSKWEARHEYSNQVTIINHSETWIKRLKSNLKRRF